jgi:hypothetical protein
MSDKTEMAVVPRLGGSIAESCKTFLHRFEVSRAVAFNVLSQGWAALSGVVQMLAITWWLSPVEQGFYYTFNSVLMIQILVELGLTTVIIQVSSHEWAFLELRSDGSIGGDQRALSRLASLVRFSLRWYAIAGCVLVLGLGVCGGLFFSAKPYPGIYWYSPWICLCLVTGLALMISPALSLIEGCNQVTSIYRFRLVQGLINTAVLLSCLWAGFRLYALAITGGVRLLCSVVFLLWNYRRFLTQLLTLSVTDRIRWQSEIWPFQWRIAVSWLSGFFVFSIFTPVMFHFHGALVAGQMGMTFGIMTAIETLSVAWISTRVPQFGILIAQHDYPMLDSLFRRVFRIALSLGVAGAGCAVLLTWGLQSHGLALGQRLLPLLPTVLFACHRVGNIAVSGLAFYLRAHKCEPLMATSLVQAVLVGFSTILLGSHYGPVGAASGLLLALLAWGLPASYRVFCQCRTQWHVMPGG